MSRSKGAQSASPLGELIQQSNLVIIHLSGEFSPRHWFKGGSAMNWGGVVLWLATALIFLFLSIVVILPIGQ